MRLAAMIALVLGLAVGTAQAQQKAESPGIQPGAKVHLEYTLTDEGGKVLDSNQGKEPLSFTEGEHQVVPGLENALEGMHAGEAKQVTVKPEDAYGEVDPTAIAEVPKDKIPPDALAVGTELVAQSQAGERRIVRVKEIKDETVVLDLNHPLAGKTLVFDVKVLDVQAPAEQPQADPNP